MRRPAQFKATVRDGVRARNRSFVVYISTGTDHRQVGFVVSRHVGSAVVRNQVRRRLRHLMQARLAGLAPDSQVVVRVLPGAGELSTAQLAQALDPLLRQASTRHRGSSGRPAAC